MEKFLSKLISTNFLQEKYTPFFISNQVTNRLTLKMVSKLSSFLKQSPTLKTLMPKISVVL